MRKEDRKKRIYRVRYTTDIEVEANNPTEALTFSKRVIKANTKEGMIACDNNGNPIVFLIDNLKKADVKLIKEFENEKRR